MMKHCFTASAIFLGLIASGCVTPAMVKDASTKHGNNLVALQQAIGNYRRQLDTYYDRLIQQQREAHIALHVNKTVETIAKTQSESISKKILKSPNSQEPAQDFILAGAALADAFVFWGNNFDRWVDKVEGETLNDRRTALRALADRFEREGDNVAAKTIRDQAGMSDGELTYVQVAIELKRQRVILDTQINALAAQVTTMQAFHDKIDEFLSIDATIDGSKIAAAAVAGSKADITGILPK